MNKKIFIALMLGATSVSAFADVTYNFGAGSTWTVKCSGTNVANATGVVINVAKAGDLAALKNANQIWDADDNPVDHNNKPQNNNFNIKQCVYQKNVVVSGNLNEADMNVLYAESERNWTFCAASTLDLSGVNTSASSVLTNISSGWANYSWCHNNSSTQGLTLPSSGNSGNGGGSTIPETPAQPGNSTPTTSSHVSYSSSYSNNDVCEIHACSNCSHSLAEILAAANITSSTQFDLVKINLDYTKNKVAEGVGNLNAYTIDLSNVRNMTTLTGISNKMVKNVILPSTVAEIDKDAIEAIKANFDLNNLISVIAANKYEGDLVSIDAYVNKPGYLANGLQYVKELGARFTIYENGATGWYNEEYGHNKSGYVYSAMNVRKLKLSGCVFARDLKATSENNIDKDGHLIKSEQGYQYQNAFNFHTGECECSLAPSKDDVNVVYCSDHEGAGQRIGAMMDAKLTHLDLSDAQFGYEDENGVFKYYPADMTISELYYLGNKPSIEEIKLPINPTQYIIPEGFLRNSISIKTVCFPSNYKEYHRYAFLNGDNGITHFTTIADEDNDQFQVVKGGIVDAGEGTLILPAGTTFVGRGAFSGYGTGNARIEDVFVLAKKAPICEFYAFDQASYAGEGGYQQEHRIKKTNYVNKINGFVMLHFPYDIDEQEMLNYSDMTREYRLYDETGQYNNLGDILVWPTRAQFNRSFNQAMTGVTWKAWKDYTPEASNPNSWAFENPDYAYAGGYAVGSGERNATHESSMQVVAKEAGWSDFWNDTFKNNKLGFNFEGTMDLGSERIATLDNYLKNFQKMDQTKEHDRPLVYDWEKYGGWHQFAIAELYDFMLSLPGDDRSFYNFGRYDKDIWYSICFPFDMTRKQVLEAFGNPETGEMPFLSTLASVTRKKEDLFVTITMSKNLIKNELLYDDPERTIVKYDATFNPAYRKYTSEELEDENQIVIEADRPYFILPCIPQEELAKIKNGYRRCEVTKHDLPKDEVHFPIATHVHAVNGAKNAYVSKGDEDVPVVTDDVYDYYFVGNYIPQKMPTNAYYLQEYQKSDKSYWSTFYRNSPAKANCQWIDNTAIIFSMIGDVNTTGSRGDGTPAAVKDGSLAKVQQSYGNENFGNYVWNVVGKDDFIFNEGKANEARSTMTMYMPHDDDEATFIIAPNVMTISTSDKIYNLNGQFIGLDSTNLPKGIYVKSGKKFAVK